MNNVYKSFLLTIFIITSSCSSSNYKKKEISSDPVMQADIKFCQYSVKEGFYNAFLKYADENIVKFSQEQFPVVGKKDLAKFFNGKAGTKSLIWEPVNGEIAQSGELGYTWGKWHLTDKDTTYYGNYFTLWKKQKDGTWKVLLDGGNSTPPPN
jgi:ketosteroid isomerase-like protein